MALRVSKARDALADAERARIVAQLGEQRAKVRAQLDDSMQPSSACARNLETMRREAGEERERAAGALDAEVERVSSGRVRARSTRASRSSSRRSTRPSPRAWALYSSPRARTSTS